jgi:hypothetical protein
MKYCLLAIVGIAACIVVLAAGFIAQSEANFTGTTSGISYSFTSGGFRNYSFTPLPSGFRYVSSNWLGTSKIDLTVAGGLLTINDQRIGTLTSGDRLEVASDQHVWVNGTMRR